MASPFLPVVSAALVLIGLASGALLVGLLLRVFGGRGTASTLAVERAEHDEERIAMRAEQTRLRESAEAARLAHARIEAELAAARARHEELEGEALRLNREHAELRRDLGHAREQCAKVGAELEGERAGALEKLALLRSAREELSHQFKALAAEIFDEKAKRFGEQNQAGMETLLSPLREKLGEFQVKVEGLQQEGVVGRTELRTHIETLSKLNDRLSAEASSLASALKGSSKTQGDWGEVLLERMLEDAGLRRGEEYRVQESFTREDGTRARPDVIVNLPGEKHLVVDAKVSLTDYNGYCDAGDDACRAIALARHIGSLREHVRGLSKRKYQALYDLHSIDFVVMFVPIEPAYLLALSKDGRLWQEAWDNDVLLVSPGTLFPVIRTVAHLWRQEQQNRNVQEIVYRGGELYDKLAAFAGDLVKIGDGLDAARTSYDKAMSKLRTGRGNAIRQAELLKGLGIKSAKQMPKEMLEALEDELVRTMVEETNVAVSEGADASERVVAGEGTGTLFE